MNELTIEGGTGENETSQEASVETANFSYLDELESQVAELYALVTTLKSLQRDDSFKFLSKAGRNEMLEKVLELGGSIDDTAKIAFRALKKVKRERAPDDVIDGALIEMATVSAASVDEAAAQIDD